MLSISKSCLLLLVSSLVFAKNTPKKSASPIINGTAVSSPTTFPYQVLITGSEDGGGTIVSKRWVLTAGHVTRSDMQLHAGVINRNNLGVGQSRTHKQYRNHPNYSPAGSQYLNDVALVEVTTPFVYGSNVTDVKLASANNQSLWNIGATPTVSGFGRTSDGGSLSNELRQVAVEVKIIKDSDNKINAGGNSSNTGNDACKGDSGGPLTSSSTQIGIVSTGEVCGKGGDYMMVSRYLDFITQTIHLLGMPDFVCGNTTFENIGQMPDGVSFQWSASPANLFTVSSGTGLTFTTSNNGSASGKGTITLTVNTPSGTFTHNKEVWVGRPDNISITTDGSFSINGNTASICRTLGYCMTSRANVELNLSSNSPIITDIPNPVRNKTISTASSFSYSGWPSANSFFNTSTQSVSNDRACFGTNNTGSYFLTVNASNSCGSNGRSIVVQVNGCGLRIFPNPAKDVVSIEFENPELLESIPDLIEIQDEKSHKIVKSSNVKAIKDREKNNPKAYSRVDFEVADLPRGTYYVQVTFDQRSEKDKTAYRIILTD